MTNIILCGMPCSGKTHFGKMAAEKLAMDFVDTDELIIQAYFKSHHQLATCREIAVKEGDPFFRVLEREAIKGLNCKKSIISIGSGAICSKENIQHLKMIGRLVYLKTPPKIILERIKNRKPLSSLLDKNNIEKSFTELLEKRIPLYEKHCDYTIDTTAENVVETIKNILTKETRHG